jgi:hypothetical protein
MDTKNNNKKLAEILTKTKEIQTSGSQKLIVCFPNYVLPDLNFLSAENYLLHPKAYRSPKKTSRRPLSLNDVDQLKIRKENFRDWDSLEFLLPQQYKDFIKHSDKPLSEREKNDPNEKEQDESKNPGGVKFRNKQQVDPRRKRYSFGGVPASDRKNKFKRFSLQEIEEITEITRGIDETLADFDKLDDDQGTSAAANGAEFGAAFPPAPNNTPSVRSDYSTNTQQQQQVLQEKAGEYNQLIQINCCKSNYKSFPCSADRFGDLLGDGADADPADVIQGDLLELAAREDRAGGALPRTLLAPQRRTRPTPRHHLRTRT